MQTKKSLQLGMVFTLLVVLVFFLLPSSISFANTNTNVTDWINTPNTKENGDVPAADPKASESAAVGFSFWDFAKTFLALAFVIVLLYAMLKFVNKRNLKYQQNQVIQNLGGLSLGAQKSVQLVQVGDTLLVIGVGEDVQVLKEITDKEQIDKLLESYYEKQELASSVPYIAELFGRFNKNKPSEESEQNSDSNFGEVLQKKLTTIKQQRSNEIAKWKKKENDD